MNNKTERASNLPKKEEAEHRINNKIRVPKVRLVGDNIEEPGIYSTADALKMADEMDLDLVEISPNAEPPVCKIIDLSISKSASRRKSNRRQSRSW